MLVLGLVDLALGEPFVEQRSGAVLRRSRGSGRRGRIAGRVAAATTPEVDAATDQGEQQEQEEEAATSVVAAAMAGEHTGVGGCELGIGECAEHWGDSVSWGIGSHPHERA